MKYEYAGNSLNIELLRDFNLLTSRQVEHLAAKAEVVTIDLSNAKIVDSESIAVLYKLIKAGKIIYLQHPPEILAEVIEVLGLGEVLDLEKMVV